MTKLTIREIIQRGASHRAQRLNWKDFNSLKVGFWDIESTDLNGDAGIILCGGVKTMGKAGVRVYRIDHSPTYETARWDDRYVAESLRDDLEQHDIIVHHYGDRFDVPVLNTRLLGARRRMLDSSAMAFVDTWLNIRKRLKLHSNRLASLIDYLDTKVHKTGLNLRQWLMAGMGHQPSLNGVIKHNIYDVEALEEVFLVLAKAYSMRYTYVK